MMWAMAKWDQGSALAFGPTLGAGIKAGERELSIRFGRDRSGFEERHSFFAYGVTDVT